MTDADVDQPGERTETVWVQDAYGGAESVRLGTRDVRPPGPYEVRVRVDAVSLNAGDRHLMRGEPLLLRLFFGLRRPRERVRGRDVAGIVVGAGSAAGLGIGDRVVGEVPGALAESVTARAKAFARVPDEVPLDLAATLPVAAGTARLAIRAAAVGAGSRVLILGAGGGVGTFAVSLAAAAGAHVEATCGSRAIPVLIDLGAATAVEYRSTPARSFPAGAFDAVIDVAGVARLRDLQRLVHSGGTIALVGGEGGRVFGPIGRMLGALARSAVSRRRFRLIAATADPVATADLLRMLALGVLRPVIDARFPFGDAPAALRRIDERHAVGKIVITRRADI